jgi:nitrilase
MANLVAIQMTSGPDVVANLAYLEQQLRSLPPERPCLVVLPECFACFGASDTHIYDLAERKNAGPIQAKLAQLAKQFEVWLVAGSFPLLCSTPEKYTASCLIFDDHGRLVDEYQKIHLFDAQVADSTGSYRESDRTQKGQRLVVVDSPFGTLGVAICYDIRFAGMFAAMSEIGPLSVLAIPAAFTLATGKAHWHPLLTARAIENQCFLVAANQTGTHANQRQTFGHSCIISPWGETLAELPHHTGSIVAHLEPDDLHDIRTKMPIRQHNQFRSYLG